MKYFFILNLKTIKNSVKRIESRMVNVKEKFITALSLLLSVSLLNSEIYFNAPPPSQVTQKTSIKLKKEFNKLKVPKPSVPMLTAKYLFLMKRIRIKKTSVKLIRIVLLMSFSIIWQSKF